MNKKDKKNNTGKDNSGYWNSGYRNSGDWNSGYRNSGDSNSGHRNSGHRNSGYRNSGDSNSGHSNSGHSNSGDWNSGYWNSGYFNLDEPKVRIFGKETDIKREDFIFPDWIYFDLTEWIDYSDMTKEEKKKYPLAEHTQGYLKSYEYKEAWKKAFTKCNDLEDIKKTLDLPNFDYNIFEEITGISKDNFDKKLGTVCKHIENVKYCSNCGNKIKRSQK